MSAITLLSEADFNVLFNTRDFNPPSDDVDFDSEFEAEIESVRSIVLKHVSPDEFLLHEYHNRSRFIDMAFNSEGYLDWTLIANLQQHLKSIKEDWMLSMWEACFVFVTKSDVFGFDPTHSDPSFAKIVRKED